MPVLAGRGQPTSPPQVAVDRGHHHALGAGAPGITDTLNKTKASQESWATSGDTTADVACGAAWLLQVEVEGAVL